MKTASVRTWANQFPKEWTPPAEVLGAGLVDISWGNDACPSFCHPSQRDSDGGNLIVLWVDCEDETLRECAGKRFVVTVNDEGGEIINGRTFETDDIKAALSYFNQQVESRKASK